MTVPQIVNSDPLDSCGSRTSIHLMMKIAFCYLEDTIVFPDAVQLLKIITHFICKEIENMFH